MPKQSEIDSASQSASRFRLFACSLGLATTLFCAFVGLRFPEWISETFVFHGAGLDSILPAAISRLGLSFTLISSLLLLAFAFYLRGRIAGGCASSSVVGITNPAACPPVHQRILVPGTVLIAIVYTGLTVVGWENSADAVYLIATPALILVIGICERARLFCGRIRASIWREGALFLVVLVAWIVWGSHNLTSAEYSVRGVEHGFFTSTQEWLKSSPTGGICKDYTKNFWAIGTYCTHPMGVTILQVGVMKVFGNSLFGWRMCSVLMSAAGAIGLFVFLRTLISTQGAWLGLVVYLFGYYNVQWMKMGYNNMYFIAPLLLSLGFSVQAEKRSSAFFAFTAGILAVLGFYFSDLAVSTPLFVGLLYFVSWRERAGRIVKTSPLLVEFFLGAALVALPLLLHLSQHAGIFRHLQPEVPEMEGLAGLLSMHRFRNGVLTAVAPFQWTIEPLYMMENFVFDVVSITLAYWGALHLILCITKRDPMPAAIFLGYLAVSVVVFGYFNIYPKPAFTRILFYIPIVSVLAGIGADFSLLRLSVRSRWMATVVIGAVIVATNLRMVAAWTGRVTRPFDALEEVVRTMETSPLKVIYAGRRTDDSFTPLERLGSFYISPTDFRVANLDSMKPDELRDLARTADAFVVSSQSPDADARMLEITGDEFDSKFEERKVVLRGGWVRWYYRPNVVRPLRTPDGSAP